MLCVYVERKLFEKGTCCCFSLVVDVDSMVAVGGATVAAVVVVDVAVGVSVFGCWLGCPTLLLVCRLVLLLLII